VVREYSTRKGQGWGALAQSLGIKPGGRQALKGGSGIVPLPPAAAAGPTRKEILTRECFGRCQSSVPLVWQTVATSSSSFSKPAPLTRPAHLRWRQGAGLYSNQRNA
jgi:hypothetical protein